MNRRQPLFWCALVLATGAALSLATRAQPLPAEGDSSLAALEGDVTRFLEEVSLGQVDAAYDQLLAASPTLKRSEGLADLKSKTRELEKRYGRYQSFERVGQRRIGQDVVLLKYLYKCENFPVVWYFTYYRPGSSAADALPAGSGWRVIALRFDTQIELLGMLD
ncbi:MAG: hypothetical protein K2Y37_22755 [Pirellulales bacterium]|nr:hypothetical protein [Pirellulales bacterium]